MKILAILLMAATLALSGCATTGDRSYDRDLLGAETEGTWSFLQDDRPEPGKRAMPYPPYYSHPKD